MPTGSHVVQSVLAEPLHVWHVEWHAWHEPALSSYMPAGQAARHEPPCSSGKGSAHERHVVLEVAEQVRQSEAQLCLLHVQSPPSQSPGVS